MHLAPTLFSMMFEVMLQMYLRTVISEVTLGTEQTESCLTYTAIIKVKTTLLRYHLFADDCSHNVGYGPEMQDSFLLHVTTLASL